jgi:hypothetical protein
MQSMGPNLRPKRRDGDNVVNCVEGLGYGHILCFVRLLAESKDDTPELLADFLNVVGMQSFSVDFNVSTSMVTSRRRPVYHDF